jgi:hypothetical protein
MRDTEHMKRHLSIRTQIDNKTTSEIPVEDPFHHTTVIIEWSLWDWLKMLWQRKVEVRVKVMSDGVSQGRWFQGADICENCKRRRIDGPKPDGCFHAYKQDGSDEQWCEACHYGYPEHTESHETSGDNATNEARP